MTMKKGENDRFKQRVARLEQRFKILISRRDFQEDVRAFRNKWHIDPKKLTTIDENQAWWHQHYENDEKWHRDDWPKYREEIVGLQKAALDLDNKKVTYNDYLDRQKEANQTRPINAYYKDLKAFLGKYRLPPKWEKAIQSYIFTDTPRYHGLVGISIRTSHMLDDDDFDKDEIAVILDAYTTKQELMDAWPNIKFHLDNLRHKGSDKFQPIDETVFERNKMAFELKQEGHSLKQIADKLNEKYEDEVYIYTDVATMIRNYKKLLGIN